MLWVGLTGGIASGKSTVAEFLKKKGIPVVHADELAHRAMDKGSKGAEEIRREFGADVFLPSGEVDRKALGTVVFGDGSGKKREKLESILHPIVRILAQADRKKFEEQGAKLAVYEIPLLFEKNLEKSFDKIICVATSPEIQIARLMRRSELTREQAEARIAAQIPQAEKVRRSDFVIENGGDEQALMGAVERVVAALKT